MGVFSLKGGPRRRSSPANFSDLTEKPLELSNFLPRLCYASPRSAHRCRSHQCVCVCEHVCCALREIHTRSHTPVHSRTLVLSCVREKYTHTRSNKCAVVYGSKWESVYFSPRTTHILTYTHTLVRSLACYRASVSVSRSAAGLAFPTLQFTSLPDWLGAKEDPL